MASEDHIHIYDVSLRDGLQRHPDYLSVQDKIRLYHSLEEAGLKEFEVTSFVNPKAVPQLADASDLYSSLSASSQLTDMRGSTLLRHDALVINERGLQAALRAGVRGLSLVLITSETLSQKNSRVGVQEALERAQSLIKQAREYQSELVRLGETDVAHLHIRAYVAAAWVCPFEGLISIKRSVKMAAQLLEWGVDEVALADTVGHATPPQVKELIVRLFDLGVKPSQLAVHLHDTLALGLANAHAAIDAGVRKIDASIGGLGGCPFAPGAAGNLATEDLVLFATRLGYETGVDMEKLHHAVTIAEDLVQRPLGGRTRSWWLNRNREAPLSQLTLPSSPL